MIFRSHSRRLLAVISTLVGVVALGAGPAIAETVATSTTAKPAKQVKKVTQKTACSILTKKDLDGLLGAAATSQGNVRKGPDSLCRWKIDANGERPAGSLVISVGFDIPPGAYAALEDNAQFEKVDGLGVDALYASKVGQLSVYKGRRIMTLQGVFNDASVRPIRTFDARADLIALAAKANERL